MSNDKQEMPVDWFAEKTFNQIELLKSGYVNQQEFLNGMLNFRDQAKEIEKQRMIEFAKEFIDVVNIEDKDIENIYNETYGGGEQ